MQKLRNEKRHLDEEEMVLRNEPSLEEGYDRIFDVSLKPLREDDNPIVKLQEA